MSRATVAAGRAPAVPAHRVPAGLLPDPSRVLARLFLPGEELPGGRSRAGAVVGRVMGLPEHQVERLATALLDGYSSRHRDYSSTLIQHAGVVGSHVPTAQPMSTARTLLLGASFTCEYALEGAALCNPSAVPHPDQSGLLPGQLRVAVSLRGIGEGHISSIGFASAVAGPGPQWTFEPRAHPVVAGTSGSTTWRREHLRSVLADHGDIDGLAHNILDELPEVFGDADLELALTAAHHDLLARAGGQATVDTLRRLVASAYQVSLPAGTAFSQRVLWPTAVEESHGMEDARFVQFTGPDGATAYHATYTAYDGKRIAPRLLTSPDLRVFQAHRLAGPAARNKGMALFPRLVAGKHWALCRSDGESNSVATSDDGFLWSAPTVLQAPEADWEVLQLGNCGPPIETAAGWLVLTHGVGPMRRYAIGAILLDLDDPTVVLGRLEQPLLQTEPDEREGYVPNVVYSCGGLAHDGRLWLPYGVGDARIAVAWFDLDELLTALRP